MRRRIPFIILIVLIVLAGAATIGSYAQSRESNNAIKMALSCSNKLGVRPSSYTLSCADANSELTGLHWFSWGDSTAFASGTVRWNDCTPNCAGGTWKKKPVTVWAWRIENGHYTRLSSDDPAQLSTSTLAPYPG